MSELRQDPISGQWVIIAPERAGRPDDFAGPANVRSCPFCGGNEHLTTAPLLEIPSPPGSPCSWRIRVLQNLYPAVNLDTDPSAPGNFDDAVFERATEGDLETASSLLRQHMRSAPALGHHEVVVESPQHFQSISALDEAHLADVVRVYRDRLLLLSHDPRLVSGLIFKNMGAAGGATLEHVHSQIVALPMVPERLRRELSGAARWQQQHGTCTYCALVEHELADGRRIVAASDDFVALTPWAARTPYETWILPRRHESHFEHLDEGTIGPLATLLRQVVAGVEDACNGGAYNYVIHSAPFDTPPGDHYHWHVEVIPRITRLAGFEWGTGWYINPVTPEAAALRLRKLLGRAEEKRSSTASLPIR